MTQVNIMKLLLLGFIVLNACSKKETIHALEVQKDSKALAVKTMTLIPSKFVSRLNFEAVTQPAQDISLRSISSGYVEKIMKQAGEKVSKGAVIAHIQTSTAKAKMLESKSNFDYVSKEFERMNKLFADGIITKSQYDEILNKKTSSENQYLIALQNYEQSIIKSPIEGILEKQDLEIGELVNPQQDLARVVDTSLLKIIIGVSSADIFKIKLDQQVQVSFGQIPNKNFPASIQHISSVADSFSKKFQVEVRLPNPDYYIKAGLIAKVEIEVDRKENALSIPKNSVLYDENQRTYVYVHEQGKAFRRDVSLGHSDGQLVEIMQGLKAMDKLVIEGQQNILPGKAIMSDANK